MLFTEEDISSWRKKAEVGHGWNLRINFDVIPTLLISFRERHLRLATGTTAFKEKIRRELRRTSGLSKLGFVTEDNGRFAFRDTLKNDLAMALLYLARSL